MYLRMYAYIYACTNVRMYACPSAYTCMHIYMYVYTNVRMYACVYVCMFVFESEGSVSAWVSVNRKRGMYVVMYVCC